MTTGPRRGDGSRTHEAQVALRRGFSQRLRAALRTGRRSDWQTSLDSTEVPARCALVSEEGWLKLVLGTPSVLHDASR